MQSSCERNVRTVSQCNIIVHCAGGFNGTGNMVLGDEREVSHVTPYHIHNCLSASLSALQ